MQEQSRCFSLFKEEFGNQYQAVLETHHEIYTLTQEPQSVNDRVRGFRKMADKLERLVSIDHFHSALLADDIC